MDAVHSPPTNPGRGFDVRTDMNARGWNGLLALSLTLAAPARAAIPPAEAARAVADARDALERDNGRLWGVQLMAPILFVDAGTREVCSSDADSAGILKPAGSSMFAGTLPAEINAANTSLHWGGRLWSMVLWPLPDDPVLRRALLIHELWHRVQADIGLPASGPSNAHLDTPDGRLWLQLEWRALALALDRMGDARAQAIGDALTFRATRRREFPGSAA